MTSIDTPADSSAAQTPPQEEPPPQQAEQTESTPQTEKADEIDLQIDVPPAAPPAASKAAPRTPPPPGFGIIQGVVLDHEDRLPLPNARVGIYRIMPADSEWTMVEGALSGADGSFRFKVPAATYRAIFSSQSYTAIVRDDLTIASGATIDLSVTLTPKPIQIQGVDVKGEEMKGSEATALVKQQNADFVTDAITSEQISKSTDSNAAEALQRVTGLSVVSGKYVYVRGLGERYSSTVVNGASVGTPEPNKKVVPLDVFPSGALENIVVQKTYTPDQEGEFAGGVIDLNTRDVVEGRSFSQSLSIGYSANVAEQKFITYQGGKLDFLGFDDGTRDYPDLFKSMAGDRPVVGRGVFGGDGFSAQEIEDLGESFNRTWSPEKNNGSPNYSYSASFGSGYRILGKQGGFLGAVSLSNTFASQTRENNAYAGTSTRLTPLYEYEVAESNAKVLGGAMANLSLRVAEPHSIRLRGLYTRSADDYTRVMQGPNYNLGTDLLRTTSLDYIERGLLLGVLSGTHNFTPAGGFQVDWLGSYSQAMRDEPDRRESVYESDGQGGMYLTNRRSLPLTRIFGEMTEYDRSASLHISKPIPISNGREAKLKVGGAYRDRSRVSSFRRLGFAFGQLARDSLDTSMPPESLLVAENIEPGYFVLQENTRQNDKYDAAQEIWAGYGMVTAPVLPKLDLLVGARLENSTQAVESKSPFVTTVPPIDVVLEGQNLLPAVNLTYRITDQMNARGGYSATLSRPELREMSPFDMYDYETGYSEVGNPEIQATTIENYDLRWEFFPGTRELLAVSAFRKLLYQPIVNVVEGSSGGYILSPRNGRDGRLYGVELESRIGVRRLYDALGHVLPLPASSSALDRWAINVNYSRVESNVLVRTSTDADGNPIFREGPLQGQATFALNAGIFYGASGLQGSLLMSRFGERLAQYGAGAYPSSLPDIYEHPPTSLDFTLSKQINGMFNLRLAGENLLNEATEYRQLGLITRLYNPGRTYSLSLSLKD